MRRLVVVLVGLLFAAACGPRYADLPMTPTQNISAAEDALRRGQYETAIRGFAEYLGTGEQTFRARAFFEMAQAQYGLENYNAALDTLDDLEEQYPGQRWAQVPALRGDIYYALGRRAEAIRQWDIAWRRGSDADRLFLRSRIETAIGELTPAEAGELAIELQSDELRAMLTGGTPPAGRMSPPAAAIPALPSPTPSRVAAPPPDRVAPELAAAERAEALASLPEESLSIPSGDALDASARVAALLPLTGPDKTLGQRALTGLRLAFSGFPRMLMVRDTGGDPALAAQLVTALAADPAVVAFIGPLRGDDAAAAAPLAERAQMPMLLLARDPGLTGAYVLRTSTSQQEQMQMLADYAVHALGFTRLGVLYPDDGYGRGYLEAFSSQATSDGATVVRSRAYRAGQGSFAGEGAAVAAWVRDDGVQAVFIPDTAATAVRVAEAARSAAPHIALLGTDSWNQPEVLAAAGKRIDGAVFTDSFFIGAGTPSTSDFVARFRAQSGYDPTATEAQAYDAGVLVREALAQGARSRGAVLQFLRGVTEYRGAGSIASGASGLKPDVVLLQVRDGHIATVTR